MPAHEDVCSPRVVGGALSTRVPVLNRLVVGK